MEITLLGTGAPLAPTRCTTGMLLTAPGCDPLLIDTCGGFELVRQLARIGWQMSDLRNIILTHQHLDHIGGMPALALASIPLSLYALAETHAAVHAFLHACFPEFLGPGPESPVEPDIRPVAVVAGERHAVGGFTVEFFAVEHRVPTVAVRVEQGGRAFAFSADGVPGDALVACARDADLFLCDALCAARDGAGWAARVRGLMHPVAREAGEMATAASAKALALTHLARFANPEHMLAEACEVYSGPVTVPDDCHRFTL
jgi:ribonuclease BN (tRNA processing enzyme)